MPAAVAAALAALEQLREMLRHTSAAQYTQSPVGVVSSSIGSHVRHCLDHFETLLNGAIDGIIDYDQRRRGTAVERDRRAALTALERVVDTLATLDAAQLEQSVRLRTLVSTHTAAEGSTTLGRELLFVFSHTVHHNALLAAMCRTLGIPVPERFGYAPATLAYLDQTACAPSPSSR